jgi:hypothetical protein
MKPDGGFVMVTNCVVVMEEHHEVKKMMLQWLGSPGFLDGNAVACDPTRRTNLCVGCL